MNTFNAKVRAGKRIDPVTGLPFPRLNKPITQTQFIRRVLYHYAGQLGEDLLINGLNLGFDLGALSHHSGIARSKNWFGAFKIRLNGYKPKPETEGKKATARDYFYPAVYFQPLGMKRNKFGWALESGKSDEADTNSQRNKAGKGAKKKAKALKAKFLDVSQLGLAMLGAGHLSMEALAKTLKTATQKAISMRTTIPSLLKPSIIASATNRPPSKSGWGCATVTRLSASASRFPRCIAQQALAKAFMTI